MKKFLSVVMMLVLLFSMTATVFAAGETGSITVTNATKDQTYTVYRIFDASVRLDDAGEAEAVSYSITTDNQFFADLFGADGTTDNAYFIYEPSTGAVTKKAAAVNADLIAYLTELVKSGSYTPAADPITAVGSEVKFENLPYGYYMILSTLGAAVTVNSNTPDVNVIDKNQTPASDFNKQIRIGEDSDGNPVYGDANTAAIGDMVDYKISFTATNYDGDKQIRYYQIHDEKGEAIWVEFNEIQVSVGGVELDRGYYLCHGDPSLNTDNWEYLGNWDGVEKNRNNAQWYLVHLGYDEFRITIPWLAGHELVDVTDSSNTVVSHALNFPEDAAQNFTSPTTVEVTYSAAVEPNAIIGGNTDNLFNRASCSWISAHDTDSSSPDTVTTSVYGIGLLKDDGSTGENLAGAQFRIFSDEACTVPVYVIPTNIKGVYIVDSLGTPGAQVSGAHKDTARELYEDYLQEYLGDDYETAQDNLVVSQVNGKLAILGLDAGTYYMEEVAAPAGYNSLSAPVAITAGEGTRSFAIFADINGNVADIQTTDGTHFENIFMLTYTVVHNSKGVELPSTGGAGTAWLITIGSMLAIGFAVFMITNKKMSVYED